MTTTAKKRTPPERSAAGAKRAAAPSRRNWALLIAAATLLSACVSAPDTSQTQSEMLSQVSPGTHLILLVHGSGDSPDDWPSRMEAAIREPWVDGMPREPPVTVSIDWADVAAKRLLAPRRGLRLGRALGRQIAFALQQEGVVTIISHSAGAFVAHGVAKELDADGQLHRSAGGSSSEGRRPGGGSEGDGGVEVAQIFLDPFLAISPLNWRFGVRNFGRFADYAVAYVNTLDPVPFTSRFPVHARAVDVSDQEHADDHWWPVEYYLKKVRSGATAFLE